jgi:hypothetical protein
MLIDGINLAEGSTAQNLSVASGTSFPTYSNIGELFYSTNTLNSGLYIYDGVSWILNSSAAALALHASNTVLHLSNPQHSLISSITASATEINNLVGTTSSIQAQLTAKLPVQGGSLTGALTLPADPTNPLHAATKQYVDNIASGLSLKASTRASTTTNITLSGTQTVDGVFVITGDRVLVKNQTNGTQNGIYVVQSGAWNRSTDTDNSPVGEVQAGMFSFVTEGTVNSDTGWVLTTNNPITLGTTPLAFTQFSAVATSQVVVEQVIKANFTGTLAIQTGTSRFYPPSNINIKRVYASLGTTGTSDVIIDVKVNGTSIFTGNNPTVPTGQYIGTAVTTNLAVILGSYITVDIISASGADCIVYLIYTGA